MAANAKNRAKKRATKAAKRSRKKAAPVDVRKEEAGPRDDLPSRDLRVEVSQAPGAGARRANRKPWTARVALLGSFTSSLNVARTTNLSAGGVFVETPLLLEVGDPVVLTFQEAAGEALKVSGRVRWATPFGTLDDPCPGMGIEFTGLDTARRRRVEALFERLPGAAPKD